MLLPSVIAQPAITTPVVAPPLPSSLQSFEVHNPTIDFVWWIDALGKPINQSLNVKHITLVRCQSSPGRLRSASSQFITSWEQTGITISVVGGEKVSERKRVDRKMFPDSKIGLPPTDYHVDEPILEETWPMVKEEDRITAAGEDSGEYADNLDSGEEVEFGEGDIDYDDLEDYLGGMRSDEEYEGSNDGREG
ncbi:hypothetical protein BDV96DRAFT_688246 [Lophiotrema nucula]|uniref:Uncharacterized protein n=1 Tax=Lophiotrema nucula TaxID=690887 RepID=A0A6A5Z4F7_9PLEO|nr:hypothetical protein BDV96DRAFT_688246 [Lophiotrema nucula]